MDATGSIEQSTTAIAEKETLLKTITKAYDKLSKRMRELIDLRLNGDLSKESFLAIFKPVEEQYLQLEQQLQEIEAETDFLKT